MITSLSHATVYVLDQTSAHDFYVHKLGFEVRTDMTMGPFRWLTVAPKGQKGLELVLMPVDGGMGMDAEAKAAFRRHIEKVGLGVGVLETDDCKRDHEALAAKGVRFDTPPTQRPYGLEAVLRDDSGNWFALVERPKG